MPPQAGLRFAVMSSAGYSNYSKLWPCKYHVPCGSEDILNDCLRIPGKPTYLLPGKGPKRNRDLSRTVIVVSVHRCSRLDVRAVSVDKTDRANP